MMNKKTLTILGTVLILAGIMSGCGTSKADTADEGRPLTPIAANIVDTPELNYRENEIPVPDGFEATAVRFLENEIFLFENQNILLIDREGNELRRVRLSENEEFAAFDLHDDGSIWAVSTDFGGREAIMVISRRLIISCIFPERELNFQESGQRVRNSVNTRNLSIRTVYWLMMTIFM